uniref:Exonuclease 3'-5' domain-containing protein 2 n=1 Tax=Corethrella appendiculata TaxID=1370023 RepID=U5ESD1_9DIPT
MLNNRTKTIISTAIAVSVGVGVIYVLTRYRRNMLNCLRSYNVQICNTAEECRLIVKKLRKDCEEYNVLGFDCEWVNVNGSRRPVALLQLSSYSGLCALIRLCSIKKLPVELHELLNDRNIYKVGVAPIDDAKYLSQDYSLRVERTLDLRYLARHLGYEPLGIAKLAQKHLNVTLDKNWRIRCSDWESVGLSDKQIDYAAKDALIAFDLFECFADELVKGYPWTSRKKKLANVLLICNSYTNQYFKNRHFKTKNFTYKNSNIIIDLSEKYQKPPTKAMKRHYSTRTKPLYDNCILQAPDGELLCTCERKKAEWYVEKNLGAIVSVPDDDTFIVRLNFEPASRAVGDAGKYYQQIKLNQCVVCGRDDSFIRKNVIPRDYRKHFPEVMKEHTSHDVLLLCLECHQKSNYSDVGMRKKLEKLCNAPLTNSSGNFKEFIINERVEIRKAARALYINPDKIPEEKKEQLREKLLSYFPEGTEISNEFLQEYSNIDVKIPNENFQQHGAKVVEYFKENQGLAALEKMWRQHFLNVMRPGYLPELWSVDHSVQRLEIRADEGRVELQDLLLAGLKCIPSTSMLPPVNGSNSEGSKSTTTENGINSSENTICDISSNLDDETVSSITFNDMNETEFFSDATGTGSSLRNSNPTQYKTIKSNRLTNNSNNNNNTDTDTTLNIDDFQSFNDYDSDNTDSTLSQPSTSLADINDEGDNDLCG